MHAEGTPFNPSKAQPYLAARLRRFVHLLTDGDAATEQIVAAAFEDCKNALPRCSSQREAEALLYRAALWATVEATAESRKGPRARESLLDRFYGLPLAEKAVIALFAVDDDVDREEAAEILGARKDWEAVSRSIDAAGSALFHAKTA